MKDIWNNKLMSNKKKLFSIMKLINIFKINNGIFHKNKLLYSSKGGICATFFLIILLTIMLTTKLSGLGHVEGINRYQIGN